MKPHMLEAVEELGEKELQWQAFRSGRQLAAVQFLCSNYVVTFF
jgi:hypothetical protein